MSKSGVSISVRADESGKKNAGGAAGWLRESGKVTGAELILFLLIFSGIVLSVTLGEGTITCGWHFVDDHEYLEWLNTVNSGEMSWGQLIFSVWKGDFATRFRPLYYPYRMLLTMAFGTNMTAYSVLRTMETILAMFLLYWMAREMKANRVNAFLFAMISMTGYQSAVWWKLGPQEEECTIFFAMGMILLEAWLGADPRCPAAFPEIPSKEAGERKSFRQEEQAGRKGRNGRMAGAFVCFLIMSLFHESYILVIPFIVCYVLVRSRRQLASGNRRIPASRRVFMIGMTIWLLVLLGIIVLFVGTNNYSGAGVSLSISPWTFADSYYYAIGGDLKYYFFIGIWLAAILLTYWDAMKGLRAEFGLFLIFVIPQFILYGKESMGERYILPVIIGFAWFFLIAVPQHSILKAKRRAAYYLLTLVILMLSFRSALIEANYYRFRGQSVTAGMTFLSDMASQYDCKAVSFLGFSNPEADQTLNAWMIYHGVEKDIYYWNEEQEHIQKVRPYLASEATDSTPLDQFDVAIAYNANDRHYTGKALPVRDGTLDQYYTKVTCGSLDLYIRNGSGIPVPEYNIDL